MAKNEDVLVNIVMASYNHEDYVGDAIQSVIDQTYQNWELIIIDDGSTDDTGGVIESFLSDNRIKFSTQENHGVAYTTNRCIEKSTGSVICFLDSDDVYAPKKLEKQIDLYHEGYDMISTKIDIVDKNGDISTSSHRTQKYNDFDEIVLSNKPESEMLKRSYFIKSSVMVSKDLIEEAGFFDERLVGAYDWHLWLRIMPLARITRSNYHGTQYRWHGKNEIIVNNGRVNAEILLICEWYWNNALQNDKEIDFEDYFKSVSDYITKEYFSIIQFVIGLYSKKYDVTHDPFALLEDEEFLLDINKYASEKRLKECKKLKKRINIMENSSFWKMRDKYMSMKNIFSK